MIHNDHLGTPQKMTDASGTVVWAADYKPFGEATITVSTITNNLRFPGQYFDAETGLHYNYYRDYNPAIGRYIESDPLMLNNVFKGKRYFVVPFLTTTPNSLHDYAYVENNPLNRKDPTGLTSVDTCERIISLVQFSVGFRDNYYNIQRLDMLLDAQAANARLICEIQHELNQPNLCPERRNQLITLLDNAERRQVWYATQIANIMGELSMDVLY
jgi:RHS repeat-associated protein